MMRTLTELTVNTECFLKELMLVLLTVFRAAAGVGTTAAADVAAAGVRTTLAPADPQQQQEQDTAQNYRSHKHPL